jgi:GH35 family endo-1,4-beta-xylanase
MVSGTIGNLSQTVSCQQETQWYQAGQETIRKQFPVDKKRSSVKPDKKLFANSFLSAGNTMVSGTIGNPSQIVSCRQETQWFQAG